jgi:flagellar FliL protein
MATDPREDTPGLGADPAKPAEVAIDTSETTRGAQKVELDLDDAPFLEEEEEVKAEPAKPAAAVSFDTPKEEKPPLDKKKLIIIGAAAFIVLIAAAIGFKLLFFKGKPDSVQTEQTSSTAPASDNATAAEPEKPEIHVRMEPFWIEQKAGPDETRFLIVRMLLGTREPAIAKEFDARLMSARNAVFYYLKNKDVQFLTDEANTEQLKNELLMVINQYVTDGKFDTLMFEEYVVK